MLGLYFIYVVFKNKVNKMATKHKSKYIDGFLLCVPKRKVAAYRSLSRKMGKVMKEYGVLDYKECIADDMKTQMGVNFRKLAKAKPNEVVVFSWISYKSKAHRTSTNKKIMKDPRVHKMCDPENMPFDCKRMSCGGFKIFVDV